MQFWWCKAKLATPGLLKIKVFWNKGCDAIATGHDVSNKILLHDSNSILDVLMWSKFANFSISKREIIITSTLYKFDQKKLFFDGRCCFKLSALGLALDMTLIFYSSVVKGLKLKVRTFWELIPTFGKNRQKGFFPPPPWIRLRYGILN